MKRRGNGEGTVLKVGYRNYKAIAVVGWKDDKHPIKRTKQGFHTATEAREYIKMLKEDKPEQRTFEVYWDAVQEEVSRLSANTQRKYRLAHERIQPIAHKDLHDVRIGDLNAIVDGLQQSSAQAIQNCLSKCYKLAIAEDYVSNNLALSMTLPTDRAEMPKMPFAKGEIDILWSAWNAEKEPILGTVLLMCYTGMMPIELARLEVSNCDFSTQTITGIGAKTEKRKSSPIIVPDIVLTVLEWLCKRANGGLLMPMTDKQYRIAFKRCMARLGLSTEHTPYDCRHTTATMYAPLLDPNTLTEVMRHTNLTMTEHYKHNASATMLKQLNLGIKKERAE